MIHLSDILPPVIYRILRRQKPKMDEQQLLKEYKTFEEAENTGAYNNKKIADIVAIKTKKYRQSIPLELKNKQDIQNLFVFSAMINEFGNEKLDVIDVGGACGAFYFFAKKYFQGSIGRWTIVETKEMVLNSKKDQEIVDLFFTEEIEEVFSNHDSSVCIAQGVIQYIPDPIYFLNRLLNSDYKFIYISRLPLNINLSAKIITSQPSHLEDNGPGVMEISNEIVHVASTILTKRQFFEIIDQSKYTIRFRFQESENYSLQFPGKEVQIENIGVLLSLN